MIHPDDAEAVASLFDLTSRYPDLRAELTLLARHQDRWKSRRVAVFHEVMGPVVRWAGVSSEALANVEDSAHAGHAVPVGPASVGPVSVGPVSMVEGNSDDPVPLSGRGVLHNRVVLDRPTVLDGLDQTLQRCGDAKVAVLLVDLDRFKRHNDLLGDQLGDEVLEVVTERLISAAGQSFAAALGSDEFVVVVEGVHDPMSAHALAEQIRRDVAEPIEVGDTEVMVTATVGVAIGAADVSATELLRDANTALFAGKDRGRDRVQVFGRRLKARAERQLSATSRLQQALRDGTLRMHYQPIVSFDTGSVVGAEALMRITSADDSDIVIGPADLIEAAEDSGLIAQLGRYLLKETTMHMARWEQQLSADRVFRVSVNVAPAQLSNRDFSAAIVDALESAEVPAHRLSLELTESILLGADPTVDAVVQELADLGIVFGLDDFGDQGASLGGLRRFPLQFLKIGRGLVEHVDSDDQVEAIISSAVSLAHQLGFTTTAVGIERDTQRDILRRLGCDAGQGYLFAAPCSAENFGDLL